jgi:hypothetical protein
VTLRLIDPERPRLRLVASHEPLRLAPRYEHRHLAALVTVPRDLDAAAVALGVPAGSFERYHGVHGGWRAGFRVPAGSWTVWPQAGLAMWQTERRGVALPAAARELLCPLDLVDAVRCLQRAGEWPPYLSLPEPTGAWKEHTPHDGALLLTVPERKVTALRTSLLGPWDEQDLCTVELHADGRCLADDRAAAQRCLLVAAGLEVGDGAPGELLT